MCNAIMVHRGWPKQVDLFKITNILIHSFIHMYNTMIQIERSIILNLVWSSAPFALTPFDSYFVVIQFSLEI